jgi:hypothetical protein
VVVYRDGSKTVIRSDQIVWQWHFEEAGQKVALLTGPVHGWAKMAHLHDCRTAKLLALWNGTGTAPEWAAGWEEEFGPEEDRK